MDSTLHSNGPTPSSLMEHKPLPLNYADVDPTIQPDAPIAPLPIELKPVTYSMVVHNQPQEQQYSTCGPSNPLMNFRSAGYGKFQHPHTDFTTPQHQSTEGGYATERKSPETSEDICHCHFITSYNYFL